MPKRTDIKKIMLIGSGPIVIGQACEFDYSGTQALKALKEEGYEVILVNSNPATIMTDPELADRTYIEPIEPHTVAQIIRQERPDALLPTLGGQTGLNTALAVAELGVLEECGVELIGANAEVIQKAESRELFRAAMENIGLKIPASGIARNLDDVRIWGEKLNFPIIVRPAYTLGGSGGGVAYNAEELEQIAAKGLDLSLKSEVMLEESVLGWKEFELEVMRDKKDNCVIICSIENLDPMGVHTGDSITVAPAQTLTDDEYQIMRDASLAIMREIGVETGGSNVQFAINPENGDMVVIEMNPRVSRSSALASKATGFPIAKIAAKLAVGYTLDEIPNDITRETMASFEPAIDYCVVKIPRFTFEKFPGTEDVITTAMKSVGETMAIGRTFKEALQKGLRSLEVGMPGLGNKFETCPLDHDELLALLRRPNSQRLYALRNAMRCGFTEEEIHEATRIDPWFLRQIRDILDFEVALQDFSLKHGLDENDPELRTIFQQAKEFGYSDRQLATLWKKSEETIRSLRKRLGILPTYYLVDTCAAEFEAYTPYYYSTYETGREVDQPGAGPQGGHPGRRTQPHRPGHRVRLLLLPCLLRPERDGHPVHHGQLQSGDRVHGLRHLGSVVFRARDLRGRAQHHGLREAQGGHRPVRRPDAPEPGPAAHARRGAHGRHQPGRHRPGRGPGTVQETLEGAAPQAAHQRHGHEPGGGQGDRREDRLSSGAAALLRAGRPGHGHRLLHGRVRALFPRVRPGQPGASRAHRQVPGACRGGGRGRPGRRRGRVHRRHHGAHRGGRHPLRRLGLRPAPAHHFRGVDRGTRTPDRGPGQGAGVVGLMNIQYAIKDDEVYIIEVNPRASRTVPFVSKATAVPLAKLATRIMMGEKLKDLDPWRSRKEGFISVKEAVFPFNRFPNVDVLLGPEMRSTGEVMGIDQTFGMAFLKSQLAAGQVLPMEGQVFISVNDWDKHRILPVAETFRDLGFRILATRGTATYLYEHGVTEVEPVLKVSEGRPNVIDHIKNKVISLAINTVTGSKTVTDSRDIRQAVLLYNIPYATTVAGAKAMAEAIKERHQKGYEVTCLQDHYSRG